MKKIIKTYEYRDELYLPEGAVILGVGGSERGPAFITVECELPLRMSQERRCVFKVVTSKPFELSPEDGRRCIGTAQHFGQRTVFFDITGGES